MFDSAWILCGWIVPPPSVLIGRWIRLPMGLLAIYGIFFCSLGSWVDAVCGIFVLNTFQSKSPATLSLSGLGSGAG